VSSSVSRPKRLAGSRRSAQTLGVSLLTGTLGCLLRLKSSSFGACPLCPLTSSRARLRARRSLRRALAFALQLPPGCRHLCLQLGVAALNQHRWSAAPTPVVGLRLTLRSRADPHRRAAWAARRLRTILRLAAQASRRRCPLSSNVRHHNSAAGEDPLWRSLPMLNFRKLWRRFKSRSTNERLEHYLAVRVRDGASQADVTAIVQALATISSFFGVRLDSGGGGSGGSSRWHIRTPPRRSSTAPTHRDSPTTRV
jgi:hypothetical protein